MNFCLYSGGHDMLEDGGDIEDGFSEDDRGSENDWGQAEVELFSYPAPWSWGWKRSGESYYTGLNNDISFHPFTSLYSLTELRERVIRCRKNHSRIVWTYGILKHRRAFRLGQLTPFLLTINCWVLKFNPRNQCVTMAVIVSHSALLSSQDTFFKTAFPSFWWFNKTSPVRGMGEIMIIADLFR